MLGLRLFISLHAVASVGAGCAGDAARAAGTAPPVTGVIAEDAGAGGAAPVEGPLGPTARADDAAPTVAATDAAVTATPVLRDAGPTTDTRPVPAEPGSACAGARLCDDFEAHTVGGPPAAPWQVSTVSGKIQVDDVRAFSGKRSVRATTEAGTYRRAFLSVKGAPTFPLPGNVMYGRLMYWLTSGPVVRNVHWTNIQGEGPTPGRTFRGFYRYGGQIDKKLMANYDTSGHDSDCWQRSDTAMPEKRWVCIEWRFNGPNNEMNYWLDGAPIPQLTVVNKGEGCGVHNTQDVWLAPVFDTIRVGWEHFQPSVAHEMWIDDVAVGSERIGCPKPAMTAP